MNKKISETYIRGGGKKAAVPRITRNDQRDAIIFLAPALLFFFVFTLYPLINGFLISLNDWNGISDKVFVGLQNYIKLARDAEFWNAVKNSLVFAAATTVLKVTLGFLFACLLNGKFRGRTVYRVIIFMPMVMSFVAVGILWTWIFNPNFGLFTSLVNTIAKLFGFKMKTHAWLGEPGWAMAAIILVDVWRWIGSQTVLFLGSLQTIPSELYEAAEMDGASILQKFWKITIPQMRSSIMLNVALCTMGGFSVMDLVYVMTGGGPYRSTETVMVKLYETAFSFKKFGMSCAMSFFAMVLIVIITAFQIRLMDKDNEA